MSLLIPVADWLGVEFGWMPYILAGAIVVAGLLGDGVRFVIRRTRNT